MVWQRKCCASECKNNYTTHSMFSFPKADLSGFCSSNPFVHKGFRRCLYWIQKSGNVTLLDQRPEDLHSRYFLCSEHFDINYFAGKNYWKLKSNAVPHLFPHNGISEEDMLKYTNWISATNNTKSKQRSGIVRQSQRAQPKNRKRVRRTCKVPTCGTTDEAITMFAFPRQSSSMTYCGTPNYMRCKLWLQAVGNESLLVLSHLHLWKYAHVCVNHFEDDQFCKGSRQKLKPTAVPSRLLPAPLPVAKMTEYDRLFHSENAGTPP